MTTIEPLLGAGILSAVQQFVNAIKLHPILVNFTAELLRQARWATASFLMVGMIFVVALAYQGHLGGEQVFSGM